jgi:hypothetical protein
MKRHAPATARNSEVIANVLAQELPDSGLVLEIASGSGEHAVFFARSFPKLIWQPSDLDQEALASVDAYAQEAGLSNLRPAIKLDAEGEDWPVQQAGALVCINMLHISPWEAGIGVFRAAARLLESGAPLIFYGPFLERDVATAASNLAFDESLKSRNGLWGLRDLAEVDALAQTQGFTRTARHAMPANNLTLVYRRN